MQKSNTRRTLSFPYVIGLCILTMILVFSGVPRQAAYAETSADLFAQVDDIMARIDVLQTDLNKAQADYDQAVADHDAATQAMNDAQDRVNAAESKIADLQARLADRAASMYKSGPTNYLDVLFGVTSFQDFLTSWDMLDKIGASDAELVQETKDTKAEAEAAREEYANQQAIAADKMSQAQDLKTQITATQESLKEEADKINAQAMNLKAQEELQAEQARQAAAAAEAMQKQIESGTASSGPGLSVISGSGVYANPCPTAVVSSPFGWRAWDNAFHQGVDLAAPQGTPIYAAEGGTVIYATYDGGYNGGAGNWVVISCGNGVTMKYMHCSVVYVSVGQQVDRGQNIAAVGSTGNSTGPHVHFQIEINGVAVDPLQFS
ncbi:MAG: peptidoglycan DD-metalloendopeptidase family protein [Eggerthellaceae bacterium]|nr:peptidoglycan DD-metalloendopeptidase family protein [Eggerthellaceae bacterium]